MEFKYTTLEDCADATGTVVVIDVLRAFSTATYAFTAGAKSIMLVSTIDAAFALREQFPEALLMGEVNGLTVDGFDFGNSPAALVDVDLSGRRMIQRTSAGTQGVVLSQAAEHLLAASFCCATATARYVKQLSPKRVTFVVTGVFPGRCGDEDRACGEYIEALLRGEKPAVAPFLQRVLLSDAARLFLDPQLPELPQADLEYSLQVDRFNAALVVERNNGQLIMQAHG